MNRILWAIVLFISIATFARADDLSVTAYCNYDQSKAEADRLLDQSPQFVFGVGRSNTGTGNVLGLGITESLSKFLQGSLSHQIGDADCRLYQVTTEIQKHVTYDLQSLQLQEDKARLNELDSGMAQLNKLVKQEQVRAQVGTSTLQNIATLQAAIETLQVAKMTLEEQVALIVLPPIEDERLDSLLRRANLYNLEEQDVLAKQSKLQNWDLSVTVGEGSNPNLPLLHTLPNETFATAQFTYSFGAPKRNRELDEAAKSYVLAASTNETGPINLAHLLDVEVTQAREATRRSIDAYLAYNRTIASQLVSIEGVDTEVARAFRIQLEVAHISNVIEIQSNQASYNYMVKYLARNFAGE